MSNFKSRAILKANKRSVPIKQTAEVVGVGKKKSPNPIDFSISGYNCSISPPLSAASPQVGRSLCERPTVGCLGNANRGEVGSTWTGTERCGAAVHSRECGLDVGPTGARGMWPGSQ